MLLTSKIFLIAISTLFSCKKIDNFNLKTSLEGKWDTGKVGGDLLWNYEQGFELMKDGTYLPRYWNNYDSTWYSQNQKTSLLTWELKEINRKNFLLFYHENHLFNKTYTDTVFYELQVIDKNTINLTGENPEGILAEYTLFRSQ